MLPAGMGAKRLRFVTENGDYDGFSLFASRLCARFIINMTLEVRHLELVNAIHAEQSITRASARLHLTQSALSHQLKNLEDRLGTQLFERNGRTMQITPAGERLLESAAVVLRELKTAEEEICSLASSPRGLVRIATQCYTCYWWLPRLLRSFNREFPDVEVAIELEATRRPIEALLAGKLDVAITNRKVADRRLRYRQLFEDELVAVVAKDHPLAGAPHIPLEAFQNETLILHNPATDNGFMQKILYPAGIVPAKVLVVQLTEAILELVQTGMGISVLAQWAINEQLNRREVVGVKIGKSGVHRQWHAVTIANKRKPKYLEGLISMLARETKPCLAVDN
jgi:LysR family transcriptional regulator for metE and metH